MHVVLLRDEAQHVLDPGGLPGHVEVVEVDLALLDAQFPISALNSELFPAPDGPRTAMSVFARCTSEAPESSTFGSLSGLGVLAVTSRRTSLMSVSGVLASSRQPSRTRYRRSAYSKASPARSRADRTGCPLT